jgi:hypothetical protein
MANHLYVVSSICFLAGAIMAYRVVASPINGLNVLGSLFFVAAASAGLLKKK